MSRASRYLRAEHRQEIERLKHKCTIAAYTVVSYTFTRNLDSSKVHGRCMYCNHEMTRPMTLLEWKRFSRASRTQCDCGCAWEAPHNCIEYLSDRIAALASRVEELTPGRE